MRVKRVSAAERNGYKEKLMKVVYTSKGLMLESEFLDIQKHDKNIVSYGLAVGNQEPSFNFAKHVVKEELQHSQAGFVDTVPAVVSEDEIEEKACLDEIDLSDLGDTQASDMRSSNMSQSSKSNDKHCSECDSPLDLGGYCMSGCDDEDGMVTFYEAELADKEMSLDHVQFLKDALESLDRSVVKEYDTESAERQFGTSGAVAITAKDDGHAKDIAKQIENMTHLRLLVLRKAFKNINKPTYVLAILNNKSEMALDESLEEKAPPGMEDMVLALKDKFGKDSPRPYQIAWSAYNKKKKKKMKEGYGLKDTKERSTAPHSHKWSEKKWHPNYTVYSCSECGKELVQKNSYRKDTDDEYDAQKDYRAMYGSRLIKEMVSAIVKEEFAKARTSMTFGFFPSDSFMEQALEDGFRMTLKGMDKIVFEEAIDNAGIDQSEAPHMVNEPEGFKTIVQALLDYADEDLEASDNRDELAKDTARSLASSMMEVIGVEWI